MDKCSENIFGSNHIYCCIDNISQGTYQGKLFFGGKMDPEIFFDGCQILLQVDRYLDRIQFPMASTKTRSFYEQEYRSPTRKGGRLVQDKAVIEQKGEKATFIVQIQYRQNATWQGKILWAEKNKTRHFRSALEMLKLIDSSLEEKPSKLKTEGVDEQALS